MSNEFESKTTTKEMLQQNNRDTPCSKKFNNLIVNYSL